jgi:hypothetical protein
MAKGKLPATAKPRATAGASLVSAMIEPFEKSSAALTFAGGGRLFRRARHGRPGCRGLATHSPAFARRRRTDRLATAAAAALAAKWRVRVPMRMVVGPRAENVPRDPPVSDRRQQIQPVQGMPLLMRGAKTARGGSDRPVRRRTPALGSPVSLVQLSSLAGRRIVTVNKLGASRRGGQDCRDDIITRSTLPSPVSLPRSSATRSGCIMCSASACGMSS